MSYIHAVILGIVEGVTEFLPVSSTAHLIITGKLLGLTQTEFLKCFDVAIQLGAIAAVVFIYRVRIFSEKALYRQVMISFIPTVILGAVFYKLIKTVFMEKEPLILGALFFGGIFMVFFETLHKEKESAVKEPAGITAGQALGIGVFQAFAFVPGVSRAMATIFGGMFLGVSRKAAVEYSFLLAVPTMCAASALDIVRSIDVFTADLVGVLFAGFIVSFFVAVVSIKFLLAFIQRNNFVLFGAYRIVFSLIYFLVFYAR